MSSKVPFGCSPPTFGINAIQGILNKRVGDGLEKVLAGKRNKKPRRDDSEKENVVGGQGGEVVKESRKQKKLRKKRERLAEEENPLGLRGSHGLAVAVPIDLPSLTVVPLLSITSECTPLISRTSPSQPDPLPSASPLATPNTPLIAHSSPTAVIRSDNAEARQVASSVNLNSPSISLIPQQKFVPDIEVTPTPSPLERISLTVAPPPTQPPSHPSLPVSQTLKPTIPAWAMRMACMSAAEKRRAAIQAAPLPSSTESQPRHIEQSLHPVSAVPPADSSRDVYPMPAIPVTPPRRETTKSTAVLVPETPQRAEGRTRHVKSPSRITEWTKRVELSKILEPPFLACPSISSNITTEPRSAVLPRATRRAHTMTPPPSSQMVRAIHLSPDSQVQVGRSPPSSSPFPALTPPPSSPPPVPHELDKRQTPPESKKLTTDDSNILINAIVQPLQSRLLTLETHLLTQSTQITTLLKTVESQNFAIVDLKLHAISSYDLISRLRPAFEEMYWMIEEMGEDQVEGFGKVQKGLKALGGDGKKRFEEVMKELRLGREVDGEGGKVRRNWAGRLVPA